jgi:anti-anti-sigma factor
MSAPRCVICMHQAEDTVTLRVEGRATMYQSPAVRKFAEESLPGGVRSLRMDLRRCTHLDSTFLGTLLCLKRTFLDHRRGEFALVSPSSECRQLLHQMGLDDIFPVLETEEPRGSAWTILADDAQDVHAFRQNVVRAHEALAQLGASQREQFGAVAACLASEARGKPC